MNVTPPVTSGMPIGHDLDKLKAMPENEAIEKLSREFEAIFVRQILRNAQKTVIESSVTQEGPTSGIYRDMMVDGMANSIRDSGGFGLADSLQRELTRKFAPVTPTTNDDAQSN